MLNDRITQEEREKIYNEVWSEPVIKVAPRYNLSDNGLRKKCHKYWIPLPYTGYWAKVYAGHDVPKAKLPEVRGELRNLVTNYVLKMRPDIEKLSDEDIQDQSKLIIFNDETNALIQKTCSELKVKEQLKKPHPLIQEFKNEIAYRSNRDQTLAKAKKNSDYYQLAKSKYREDRTVLPILVSDENFERAIRIMDAVITTVEDLEGFTHKGIDNDKGLGHFWILGEFVSFSLTELVISQDKRKNANPVITPKIVFKVVEYDSWIYDRSKKIETTEFVDSENEVLEDQVGKIVYKILQLVNDAKVYSIVKKRVEAREIEYRKRQLLIKEHREKELQEIEQLDKLARSWEKAESIRNFANAIEAKFNSGEFVASEKRVSHLIKWAREKADWLDPFVIYEDELLGKKSITILMDED